MGDRFVEIVKLLVRKNADAGFLHLVLTEGAVILEPV